MDSFEKILDLPISSAEYYRSNGLEASIYHIIIGDSDCGYKCHQCNSKFPSILLIHTDSNGKKIFSFFCSEHLEIANLCFAKERKKIIDDMKIGH